MLPKYRNYAFNRGIMMGFGLCLITFFFYIFNYTLLFQTRINTIFFLIFFSLFPIFTSINLKKSVSSFKDYFSIIFLMMATSSLVYTVFVYFLYNSFDENVVGIYGLLPSLLLHIDNGLNFSVPLNNFSFSAQLNSYIFWLMPCTLFASLISLLMKKII